MIGDYKYKNNMDCAFLLRPASQFYTFSIIKTISGFLHADALCVRQSHSLHAQIVYLVQTELFFQKLYLLAHRPGYLGKLLA